MVLIKDPAMTHPLRVRVCVCVSVCAWGSASVCEFVLVCVKLVSAWLEEVCYSMWVVVFAPPPPTTTTTATTATTKNKKIKTLSHTHTSTIIRATTKADRKHQICEGNMTRQATEQKVRGYGTLKGQSSSQTLLFQSCCDIKRDSDVIKWSVSSFQE